MNDSPLSPVVRSPETRLFLFAAITRLIPAALIFGTEDVSAWYRTARIIASGANPYDTPFVSWPPLWPAVTFLSDVYAEGSKLPFYFVVKLLPIAADIVLTFVLYSVAAEFNLRPYRTAMAYALNPIAIYTSAIHGNFDAIPALCLTMAIVFAGREVSERSGARAGVWLGIGAAFKTWPLLMLPAVVAASDSWRRKFTIAASCGAVFLAALLLPWPVLGPGYIVSILHYRGYSGFWGIPSMEFLAARQLPGSAWVFYAAMAAGAGLVLAKRTSPARGALLLLLTFYLFTPGFGLQYLVWIVPIALLADQRRCLIYSTVAAVIIFLELMLRPYTGHMFDSLRILPHADFARSYGGPLDQRYTAAGRLVLWALFAWWWTVTVVAVVREQRPHETAAASG